VGPSPKYPIMYIKENRRKDLQNATKEEQENMKKERKLWLDQRNET